MADLKFQEPEYARPLLPKDLGGLLGLVQRWGLAKNDRQARVLLLIVACTAFVAAVFLNVSSGEHKAPTGVIPADGFRPDLHP